jgi:Magnesium chelatase, subunit ChlI C-terminal/Magnesium chelatase, subunit ChlI
MKECTCPSVAIQKYMGKISGPLMDRIDLHIEVPAVKYRELASKESGECSAVIRDRVIAAGERQIQRFTGRKHLFANADMQSKEIREFCRLDGASEELLKMAITKLGLSARTYDRILKVARTIADLGASGEVRPEHIGVAIQYRSLDRPTFVVGIFSSSSPAASSLKYYRMSEGMALAISVMWSSGCIPRLIATGRFCLPFLLSNRLLFVSHTTRNQNGFPFAMNIAGDTGLAAFRLRLMPLDYRENYP